MNPIWLGVDPGLAIVGWAILEEAPMRQNKTSRF